MARCNPTPCSKVPVAQQFLKRYRLEMVDHQDPDAEEIDIDTTAKTDEAAALEDAADLAQNGANILLYNTREMKSQGNYIVERFLKAEYRQGWRYLTRWAWYSICNATWVPMTAFFHAHIKLNELYIEFCLDGALKYDTAMQGTRRLSQNYEKQADVEENTSSMP